MNELFRKISAKISGVVGSPLSFALAIIVIILWAASGPRFSYSDTWQLVINTGTTIITFLMVFIIQNTQNRDTKAIHLKLDELIKGVRGARNGLIDLEEMTDEELNALQKEFQKLREKHQEQHDH